MSCSAGTRIPFRKRGKPILIQYDVQASIKKIVAGLPLDGRSFSRFSSFFFPSTSLFFFRLFVQEPNAGHLHGGDADIPFRLGRVNEEALAVSGGVDAMVAALKGPLDANLQGVCGINGMSNIQCKSGIITVDEINFRFHDGTKHAAQLSCAMRKLAAMPYPLGGSYASRIHFFISPSMTREIGVPRKWKRTYKKVQQALKLAGGVWMEVSEAKCCFSSSFCFSNMPNRCTALDLMIQGTGLRSPPSGRNIWEAPRISMQSFVVACQRSEDLTSYQKYARTSVSQLLVSLPCWHPPVLVAR